MMAVDSASISTSPFLDLPSEIRLRIYHFLLTDHTTKTIRIAVVPIEITAGREYDLSRRPRFSYMVGMRLRTATYGFFPAEDQFLHPSILRTNRQIHSEASHVLYSSHAFDFGLGVEAVVPFFSILTAPALSFIQCISLVKRSLPHTKYFDRSEWSHACAFIRENLHLTTLNLTVVGGTPVRAGRPITGETLHQTVKSYSEAEFDLVSRFEEMEWARELADIGGLRDLSVTSQMELCPFPSSHAMSFFINFSASIEDGFAKYLRGRMVTAR